MYVLNECILLVSVLYTRCVFVRGIKWEFAFKMVYN